MKWIKIAGVNFLSAGCLELLFVYMQYLGGANPNNHLVLLAPMILFALVLVVTCLISAMTPMWFGGGSAMDSEVKFSMGMMGVLTLIVFYFNLWQLYTRLG